MFKVKDKSVNLIGWMYSKITAGKQEQTQLVSQLSWISIIDSGNCEGMDKNITDYCNNVETNTYHKIQKKIQWFSKHLTLKRIFGTLSIALILAMSATFSRISASAYLNS